MAHREADGEEHLSDRRIPRSLAFSPEEWLALFPAAPPPGPDAFRRAASSVPPPDADPADEARQASPLTPRSFIAALSFCRPAALIFRATLFVRPAVARFNALYLLVSLPLPALIPPLWLLNDGRFAVVPLTVATVLRAVSWMTISFGLPAVEVVLKARLARAGEKEENPKGSTVLDGHPWAVFARWKQLAGPDGPCKKSAPSPDSTAGRSRLLCHKDRDPLCPCPRPSCAGSLAGAAAGEFVFLNGLRVTFNVFLILIATYWTTLVTFGSQFWASPWAVAGAFSIAGVAVGQMIDFLGFVAQYFSGEAGCDAAPPRREPGAGGSFGSVARGGQRER
ncbi:hypothetical protein DFJ74DRAFT_672546 [Hyaloraphidium curvatum]|nr:hypothetical protein DFJ74DRAFT_672546 [Hyaloraphidium curvatum]